MPAWYILITLIAISIFGLFFGLALGRWLHTRQARETLGESGHPWVQRGMLLLGGSIIAGLILFGDQEGQGFLTLMAIVYILASLGGLFLWMVIPPTTLFKFGLRLRPVRTIQGFWEIRKSLNPAQLEELISQIMKTRRRRRAADQVLGEHDYYHPARREESLKQAFELHPRRSESQPLHTEARRRVMQACQILGVQPGDSWSDIKKKYRKLVRQHHPDRPEVEDDQKLRKIIQAWKIVGQAHPQASNSEEGQ